MQGWNLDPDRVEKALKDTVQAADDLAQAVSEEAMGRISADILSAGQAVTPFVPEALSLLIQREGSRFIAISNRLRAGIIGVQNAEVMYMVAQQAMRAEIDQRSAEQAKSYEDAMLAAASTGDLSYFRDHGVVKPQGPDHTAASAQGGATWPAKSGRLAAR